MMTDKPKKKKCPLCKTGHKPHTKIYNSCGYKFTEE